MVWGKGKTKNEGDQQTRTQIESRRSRASWDVPNLLAHDTHHQLVTESRKKEGEEGSRFARDFACLERRRVDVSKEEGLGFGGREASQRRSSFFQALQRKALTWTGLFHSLAKISQLVAFHQAP